MVVHGDKRKGKHDKDSDADAKRVALQSNLTAMGGARSSLATLLHTLYENGMLNDGAIDSDSRSSMRRELQDSMERHSKADTPYGKVVQLMEMNLPELQHWEYCHPMALLYHLSTISDHFAEVMNKSKSDDRAMRIVIYVDECEPGNPLRPEKSRMLQCVYWAFVDWPAWLLRRSGAWPVFGFMRSIHADMLPGGESDLMRRVLLTFWPPEGHSFSKGIVINHKDKCEIIRADFAGFLADDAAHTAIGCKMGASGTHITQPFRTSQWYNQSFNGMGANCTNMA